MAVSVVPSGTVLGDDNYNNWRACMKSYMLAHDLWDVVESSEPPHHAELKAWKRKNAAALHAIQTSCAPHILSMITEIELAKSAWEFLADMCTTQQDGSEAAIGVMTYEETQLMLLKKKIQEGNWLATREHLHQHPQAIIAELPNLGGTILHVAARARNAEIVENLVELMSAEDLEVVDKDSNKALDIALEFGNTRMVRCLIRKNGNLLSMLNKDRILPLVFAAQIIDEHTCYYLYTETPIESLQLENCQQGYLFLSRCIGARMFDLALHVLERFPMPDAAGASLYQWEPLRVLSEMPEVFRSGCRLPFWKQWIYSCLPEKVALKANTSRRTLSNKTHLNSRKILHNFCHHMSTMPTRGSLEGELNWAWQQAIKNGIKEIIVEVAQLDPEIILRLDEHGRNLFSSSILNRQEKIFNLYYGLEGLDVWVTTSIDKYGNTILHMAAYPSPPSQLARISGAALQMQRELQWYKEIEGIIIPAMIDSKNNEGYTARELFTLSHKDLAQAAEKWMKETATSCTFVGALMVTIMFAVAFTVPGGIDDVTGLPKLLHKNSFITFMLSDAISLFAATTSVLTFLGILTSRYAEEDFLRSLPKKLIIGLCGLFISLAAMMVAFCAALIITSNGRLGIVIPVILLAGASVAFFLWGQFPLLFELWYSTYGPGIFNKKMKRWF